MCYLVYVKALVFLLSWRLLALSGIGVTVSQAGRGSTVSMSRMSAIPGPVSTGEPARIATAVTSAGVAEDSQVGGPPLF